MSEKTTNTTNNDILSGKGLKPLSSSTQTNQTSGVTIENRAQNREGLRWDHFSKDTNEE